ncbi:aldehyde dehydrogenase (NADP(+)), partial [Lacticaseibacillus rhamnosus]
MGHCSDQDLSAEVFGPVTLLVKYSSREELIDIARSLEGKLTATIHATGDELNDLPELCSILETKCGRLLFNGFPTGV